MGHVTVTITIPAATPGDHIIVAYDGTTLEYTIFTITRRLW